MRPLEGLTVVAVEQAVAAPFATRQLADLGARVIKIERPDGGDFARGYDTTVKGLSSYFVWLNRSKQSMTLDLKQPQGAAILTRLIDRADVFVQNLAPGAADRLGTSANTLRAAHPRLIVCNISGYGTSGPFATKKAYDLLIQSEVGLVSITGSADEPAKVGISVADIAAGMYAYSGVLAALVARHTTGRGTTVDVSLFDALGEWMAAPMYYAMYAGAAPARSGANHASIAPYGPFKAAGGEEIFLAIQNAREWTRFCADVLGRGELAADERFATNPLRVQHRAALHEAIESVLSTMDAAQLVARLESAGIASARMNGVEAFAAHPQLTGRALWRDVASPAGPLRALPPPAHVDGIEPAMGGVPALGQHTDAILGELGFGQDDRARLRAQGVV